MKIGPGEMRAPAPSLPIEIVDIIVSLAVTDNNLLFRQHQLYSCCLVSRDWYSATVQKLYARPLLGTNFELFSRAICPPVSSRTVKVGLEHMVVELDMGNLGYESTRSQTARLLRRCGKSLERFVAPAVSFSYVSSCAHPFGHFR